MRMGGVVPLGYDVQDKKLVVNQSEAEAVSSLFRLYLELSTVERVKQTVDHLGLRTKMRNPNGGKSRGGQSFTRGFIHKLLSNPVDIGEISHKGERHPGTDDAIIDLAIGACSARLLYL